MAELEDTCHSIMSTAFDDDKTLPYTLRRTACFNPDTARGCCMALCSSKGYRCQRPAKFLVNVKSSMIQSSTCEDVVVGPIDYALIKPKIRLEKEGTLMLCQSHYDRIKKGGSVWAAVIKPMITNMGWVVCTGEMTVDAITSSGFLSSPTIFGSKAVETSVDQAISQTGKQ